MGEGDEKETNLPLSYSDWASVPSHILSFSFPFFSDGSEISILPLIKRNEMSQLPLKNSGILHSPLLKEISSVKFDIEH